MTSLGLIYEVQNVQINGIDYQTKVNCEKFSAETTFFLDNNLLDLSASFKRNEKLYSRCCINTTHSIREYGHCNAENYLDINLNRKFYKVGKCDNFDEQEVTSFILEGKCLKSIWRNSV